MTHFSYNRHLHHYETDADGVCHFSNYLRIFEEAFEFSLAEIGLASSKVEHGFAVVGLQADYAYPVRAGEKFTAVLRFTSVKRSFFEAHVSVGVGDKHCALIKAKLAVIERKTNGSISLSPMLREKLNTLIAE
ncbi:acyl-CoA thioesterase [Pseudomonas viridiflava]|uniref:acyl-CoA thioesterase n=1 Tax=Pseudomonas viridiflava TaxID=33069 RepID=UPI000F03288D|nr:thioesterase family protein [Pseudomonas viridiflava]